MIQDTLPEYLADAKVTKITIGATETDPGTVFEGDALTGLQFGEVAVGTTTYEKAILIPWATLAADGTYTNTYAQGAQIVIEYEATLTSTTNINAADTNTILSDLLLLMIIQLKRNPGMENGKIKLRSKHMQQQLRKWMNPEILLQAQRLRSKV